MRSGSSRAPAEPPGDIGLERLDREERDQSADEVLHGDVCIGLEVRELVSGTSTHGLDRVSRGSIRENISERADIISDRARPSDRLDEPGRRYQMCVQEVAMAQVIVRNLDDEVVASLKLKAKLKGHSLEQELRDILKRAAELSKEEKLALIDSIRSMTPRRLEDDSADLIREDRDSR
jgi:plasmid stability protein